MIRFLKTNWLWLLFMSLLALLIFYFIPGQEKHYLREENKAIERISKIIVLSLWGILVILLIITTLRNFKLADIPSMIIGAAVILLTFYLVLPPFIQSGIYLLNRVYTREVTTKEYIVEAFNKNKTFLIFFDNENKEVIDFPDQLIIVDTSKINPVDTIRVSFKKGLLGYNYIPKTIVK